jgi:GNAT superfamily N-acetyltransferase
MRYILFTPTDDDLPAIAELINAHSLAVAGTRRALIDADGDLRLSRYVPMAAERRIARAAGGQLIAFTHINSRPPHNVVEIGCTLHPAFQSDTLGEALLAELVARACAMVSLAPEGVRVVAQMTIQADDAFMLALLTRLGFQEARQWVHLELNLQEAPAVESIPGVTIREMDQRVDWPAVGAAMDEAFVDHWGEMNADRRTLLEEDEDEPDPNEDEADESEQEDDPYSNSLGLCFVAEAGGRVIGSCLCNARTVEWPDAGKLGSLSVLRPYRRAGVGRALTAVALAEFHRRGIRRVITDTDNASFTGANRLYLSFGFRPYRYELVMEKELRPGEEWRALSTADLRG